MLYLSINCYEFFKKFENMELVKTANIYENEANKNNNLYIYYVIVRIPGKNVSYIVIYNYIHIKYAPIIFFPGISFI